MDPEFKQVKLPMEIGPELIGLPTKGARVSRCTLVRKGQRPPGLIAFLKKAKATTDYYCITGYIRSVDPRAENIRFEVGIPLHWNGKAIHQGGGGLDGYVPFATDAGMCAPHPEGEDALTKGYAVFGSDSGHSYPPFFNTGCKWSLRQEALENFTHKALKKTYDVAKQIILAYCGTMPEKVYFFGGSNGGRECFKAIENWPGDYDGAVCFFPVLQYTLHLLKINRDADVLERLGNAAMVSKEQCEQVAKIVSQVLDADDGTIDGFYSGENLTSAQEARVLAALENVLTEPQLEFLKSLAAEYRLPYPLPMGDDRVSGYPVLMGCNPFGYYGSSPKKRNSYVAAVAKNVISCMIMGDASFDPRDFNAADHPEQVKKLSQLLDADDCNLDGFFNRDGKIILVHGNLDPLVCFSSTRRYYERLQEKYGEKLREHLAFFYAPGYGHGGGGPMWYYRDMLKTLEDWTEDGNRPEVLLMEDRNGQTMGRTRPLYEYPHYAVYTGSGDPNGAQNYIPNTLD